MSAVDESFNAFGRERGLENAGGQPVDALTPLLARAEGTRLEPAWRGRLAHGEYQLIGLLRYEGGHALGATGGGWFEFVVAITRVAEAEQHVPRLFCRRRGRVESPMGMGMELDSEAIWTESEALSAEYEVVASPYQDPNWMRQLFSPAFIDWLTTRPPPSFAFELAYGDLAGSIDGTDPDPADLDALWETTAAVAARIRDECLEEA